jgi:hypothetical protein
MDNVIEFKREVYRLALNELSGHLELRGGRQQDLARNTSRAALVK